MQVIFLVLTLSSWKGVLSNEKEENVTKNVLDWWSKLDIAKPIKCRPNFPSYFRTDRVAKPFDPMVCVPCPDGFKAPDHSFRGDITGHVFDGPGMLKFKHDHSKDGWKRDTKACYTFPKQLSLSPNSTGVEYALGTWKAGAMDGSVKVGFQDGTFTIAQVSNGVLHGIARSFDKDAHLQLVNLIHEGRLLKGHWRKVGSSQLVLVKESPEEGFPYRGLVLDTTGTKRPMAGHSYPLIATDFRVATNVHATSEDDCMLDISWTEVENEVSEDIPPLYIGQAAVSEENLSFCKSGMAASDTIEDFYTAVSQTAAARLSDLAVVTLDRHSGHLGPVDSGHCQCLVCDITLVDMEKGMGTAKLLGGETTVNIKFRELNVDSKNRYTGIVQQALFFDTCTCYGSYALKIFEKLTEFVLQSRTDFYNLVNNSCPLLSSFIVLKESLLGAFALSGCTAQTN